MRIPPCAPLPDVVDCIRRTERAGYGTVWVPDSQFLFRDAWMALAAGALTTDRIRLAAGVTNLRTRHPSVTASALQTLEEAAPGRTALGIGTGDSSVKTLGWSPSRLAELEEGVAHIRDLGAGRAIDLGGGPVHLHGATGRVPPLVLGATGPKSLRLAGRVADGVLMMVGIDPALVARALDHVEAGLAAAGRRREDIEVCVGAVCSVVDGDTDVVRIAKPHCAGDAQRGAAALFEASGVRLHGTVPATVPEVYPDITHADDWDAAVAVAGRWVDDDAARRYAELFTLIGTPDSLVDRIGRAVDAGADTFYLRHFRSYVLPDDLIDRFGSAVLPRVGEYGAAPGRPVTR
jgi:5,10-methylenetetrahydromethanopterin reductase